MRESPRQTPRWRIPVALFALAFGLLTVGASGGVLFGGHAPRAATGEAVGFVVWFNFVAGFAYMAAGFGLYRWRPWTAGLSALIAAATALVFAALGLHIFLGGAFEMRTVGAMIFRTVTWVVIALIAWRAFSSADAV
jgi:hypothetical protein